MATEEKKDPEPVTDATNTASQSPLPDEELAKVSGGKIGVIAVSHEVIAVAHESTTPVPKPIL